jgi:hypothetical protein
MPEIAGHAVEFGDRLPARQWWELYPKVAEVQAGDRLLEKLGWDVSVAICQSVITSWEFDGDPADPAAYEALNFMDMLELVQLAFNHAVTLMGRRSEDLGE